jgi:hypothetical protein
MASVAKTLVVEETTIISTPYNRRTVDSSRLAMSVDNFANEEILLAAQASTPAIATTSYLKIKSDGLAMTVTLTKGSTTLTVALNQLLLLTDAFSSVVVTNNNLSGGAAQRVAIFWA